jgi:hypothetical protein
MFGDVITESEESVSKVEGNFLNDFITKFSVSG